ncbi:MAG TPA: alpha/beta hydrolase [Burkholderiaceae bacterium]|jgi:hypothetical protein
MQTHDQLLNPDHLRLLVVPGLYGSGEGHWQTVWQGLYPWIERVEQDDWATPDLAIWSAKLQQALRRSDKPVLVAAHSFGTLTTIHAAAQGAPNLAGALLVAPADPDKFGLSELLSGHSLTFPALVLGSTSDPWMSNERAALWARRWGAPYRCLGDMGHINAESGLGKWPEGISFLQELAVDMQNRSKDMRKNSFSL